MQETKMTVICDFVVVKLLMYLQNFQLTTISLQELVCGATSTGEEKLKGKEISVCATQQMMLF